MAYSKTDKVGYYGKRPFWQWLVIYLLVGGLIYAGIYYFYMKKGANPYGTVYKTLTQTMNQNTVTITATGYEPANITIKAGTTVTWTNKSGNKVTVSSDPHPTHTSYPPLNIGLIKDGASASLTFPTPGKYGYHNHLQPTQTGTVTVQ